MRAAASRPRLHLLNRRLCAGRAPGRRSRCLPSAPSSPPFLPPASSRRPRPSSDGQHALTSADDIAAGRAPFTTTTTTTTTTTMASHETEEEEAAPTRALSLTNRCNESKSPYVRSHASNPTAWQLWTPATLQLARDTNRLLFVSIGYSACHWCHVMAHESFADPRVAQLLNEHFIPVKIDREERPDVDRQYMNFVQATTGGGGWPLNVFITPELQPIFGGTYWPGPGSERARLDGGGAGFEQILLKVATAWKEQEQRCRDSAREMLKQLSEFAQEGSLGGRDGKGDDNDGLELDLLDDAFRHYQQRFDPRFGGFGAAPKFPTPVHIKPLLRVASYRKEVREIIGEDECVTARAMAVRSLEAMAKGGIKDQIGNGFARYSVTRDWSLPHFEKMLYDNAQLLPVYLDAYLLTKSPLLLETTHDIATYLTSPPMASPLGGICSAEDADSLPTAQDEHKREGAYYVWTLDEFKRILTPEELAVSAKYWGVHADGNIDPRHDAQGELRGQNTLSVQYEYADLATELAIPEASLKQTLASSRAKLLAHRSSTRPRPALDDKLVVSWNGLALGGLARAGAALATPAYTLAAEAIASCIRTHLFSAASGTLKRVYREGPGETPGFADDYAFLISGLLDLYECTADATHLRFADTLQKTQNALFWDEDKFGFFSTPAHQPDILLRTKDGMDNAEPSVNGVSANNLFRLAALLEDRAYEKMAKRTVAAFDVEIQQHPGLFSGMLASVVASKMGMRSIVVVDGRGSGGEESGEPGSALVDRVLRKARESVRPNTTVLRLGGARGAVIGEDEKWLLERNPLLKEFDRAKSLVQVCEGGVCRLLDESEVEGLFVAE